MLALYILGSALHSTYYVRATEKTSVEEQNVEYFPVQQLRKHMSPITCYRVAAYVPID